MQFPKSLLAIACGLLLSPAFAADEEAPAPAAAPAKIEIGATTDALLGLQRSGLAAGQLQPVQGEVASRNYQRYLDSFKKPTTVGQIDQPATAAAVGSAR